MRPLKKAGLATGGLQKAFRPDLPRRTGKQIGNASVDTDAIIFCWCLSDPHLRGLATIFSRNWCRSPRARPADDGLA
jgi:hypothetical protein